MKLSLVAVLASFLTVPAFAASIASCASVEHHGDYVEIKDDNGVITVAMSNDGDDGEVRLTGVRVTKRNIALIDGRAASWAIRQAIRGARDVDQSGVVVIKGKKGSENILINLNTFVGSHFVVRGEYVQAMNCEIPGEVVAEQ